MRFLFFLQTAPPRQIRLAGETLQKFRHREFIRGRAFLQKIGGVEIEQIAQRVGRHIFLVGRFDQADAERPAINIVEHVDEITQILEAFFAMRFDHHQIAEQIPAGGVQQPRKLLLHRNADDLERLRFHFALADFEILKHGALHAAQG